MMKNVTNVRNATKPIILLWIPPYHDENWQLPDTEICGGGCQITRDRSRVHQSQALVYYMKATDDKDIPKGDRYVL